MAVRSIGRIIGALAKQNPAAPAITCEGRSLGWRELDNDTNRLARAYQQLGYEELEQNAQKVYAENFPDARPVERREKAWWQVWRRG